VRDIDIFVPLGKVIDIDKEKERLTRNLNQIKKELERSERKLSSSQFLQKAPLEVVEKEKEKREELSGKIKKLEKILEELSYI